MQEQNSTKRIRLSVEMNEEMRDLIDGLVEQTGTSRADVLRRAIALLKTVKEAEANGESPALISKEGKVTVKLVGA